MTAPLCFIDIETTGLDPERHEPWEIAVIRREPGQEDEECVWLLRPNLGRADPDALRIGRFYERTSQAEDGGAGTHAVLTGTAWHPQPKVAALEVAQATAGAHLVGAVPSFDAAFLARWLRLNGAAPSWHYHLICVEAVAAGLLWERWRRLTEDGKYPHECHAPPQPPWDTDELSELILGARPREEARHTALGDARWARAMWDACTLRPGAST